LAGALPAATAAARGVAAAPPWRSPGAKPSQGQAGRDLRLEHVLLYDAPALPLPLLKLCDFK
jgi:hypothetical protein